MAALHDTINVRGYADVVLDFSRCSAAFSNGMLPICAHVLQLQAAKIDVQFIPPEDSRIRRLFVNTGWAHLICPRDADPPKRDITYRQFPAVQYRTHDEQGALLNELLEKLLAVIPNFNRTAFAAVEWALNEISDNVINHSQSPIGGLLQLSVFDPMRHRIEFTVSDAGLGVSATLRSARPEIRSDVDALMESVKSGVTRNATEFQGNGLYGTLEICRVGGGKFSINAGNAALICAEAVVQSRNEAVPFSGTTVDAFIDFSEPELLEKALAIDGRPHRPIDYIELRYEQDDLGSIMFKLSEHTSSVRSRYAGRPVKTKLANIIEACRGQQIVVDFEGISVISSSFADEVFGKLFAELGPMRFMQSVRLVNVTPTVQALIDRAMTQRLQL
ncbi:STAS-like domain-containing protein [Povalibacter sp.]|uniref:STAS-like domain-containing protein n=1 Tax=Povalibacter sp. TaxID=1962978 RepID=UPI002D1F9AE1|nr:STAS-like domain-containing protein [Povalibacter sp.]